jgi:hypothetical protein
VGGEKPAISAPLVHVPLEGALLECSVAPTPEGRALCSSVPPVVKGFVGLDDVPMPLQEHNYWLTTAEFPAVDAAHGLPEVVDVAVIGAGFTGLSAARTLAKRGAKVVVLESETIGWGASSRNGGMVLTGMKLGVNQLVSMYGRELTQRMYAASLATIDCVEQIVSQESIDCKRMSWTRRLAQTFTTGAWSMKSAPAAIPRAMCPDLPGPR